MKKGYTLVELLGVLVILALIISLVTPSIINFFKKTTEEINEETLKLIYNASDLFISNHTDSFPRINGSKFEITFKDLESSNLLPASIKTTNSKQNISEEKCIQVTYLDGEYQYEIKNNNECEFDIKCKLKDNDKDGLVSLSDEITCGTESFYVMDNDGNNITMLTKYNLNVGDNKYPNKETYGIQDEHVFGWKEGYTTYGNVAFSTARYWIDDNSFIVDTDYESHGRSRPYVYGDYKDVQGNQQNIIYPYVEFYELYLKESGLKSANATLISYEQAEDLNVNKGNPSWLYNTTYWMGSASSEAHLITYDGSFYSDSSDNWIGIRPVVTISTDSIEKIDRIPGSVEIPQQELPEFCSYTDNDFDNDISIGDLVTCKTESFYVIEKFENSITTLAKYNLNVGDTKYPNQETYGIQDENITGSNSNTYGIVPEDSIQPYVSEYETYLKENLKIDNVSATLMTYDQTVNLGCNGYNCSAAPEWLRSTTFWLGTEDEDFGGGLLGIKYGGGIEVSSVCIGTADGDICFVGGVRPLITLPLIKK